MQSGHLDFFAQILNRHRNTSTCVCQFICNNQVLAFLNFSFQIVFLFFQTCLAVGNEIKLIGRVRNQVLTLQNGFDSFLIRTASKTIGNLIGYCLILQDYAFDKLIT